MNFTFGIITSGNNLNALHSILDSIYYQIPSDRFQIILVGGEHVEYPNLLHVPFDENQKRMWITKKKNIITDLANYENIVYLHDYISLLPGWYNGQIQAGEDFSVRMDKIFNHDGTRFRDWCLWPHNDDPIDDIVGRECLIPYEVNSLSKYMYISGAYWIAKKSLMLKYRLNEDLSWGEGEDVEWSKQVRLEHNFQMNTNSSVQILKSGKDRVFEYTTENTVKKILDYVKLKENGQ